MSSPPGRGAISSGFLLASRAGWKFLRYASSVVSSDRRTTLPVYKEVKPPTVLAPPPQSSSFPAPAEPHRARTLRDRSRAGRALSPVQAPSQAAPASLAVTVRESKEILFILAGIALAFTIHFGFGDFVKTESNTPELRSPLASANEIGQTARIRAAAFERAGERAARRRRAVRRNRTPRAVAPPRVSAASSGPTQPTPPPRVASPPASTPRAPAPAPAPRPAPSKPRPAPASNGGGGGQSFDDSG
jgi:hypothetical protein